MHFLGMMALTLQDDQGAQHMMAFAPGLTALSAFNGALIVAAGFILAGDPNKPRTWKNLLGGVAGGLGVSVMHYTGPEAILFLYNIPLMWI
jgi:NO-binding membrane sensor protein with MHYT domain